MSIKEGNYYFKLGDLKKAILEYSKIDKSNPLYQSAQFNIQLAEKRSLTASSQSSETVLRACRPDKQIGYYRILGNSIGDLHVNDQAYTNLMHIVQQESVFDDVEKWFVINRLVNRNDQKRIIEYLEEHKLNYEVIDFEMDEYKKIGYDFGVLPDSSFWFSKKNNWTSLVANTAVRKRKNSYLMNNNGSRNFALRHGKIRYEWTMPWDGNCFLSDCQFAELKESFRQKGPYKYVCTPMERVVENSGITSIAQANNAVEEPQISFRYDAKENFNEEMVYGNKPKVEIFRRLGYPGKWDEFEMLYPWEKFIVDISVEAGQYIECSSVFRLSAGNAETAESGSKRSHIRAHGIIETIDEVECIYVQENTKSGSHKQMINNIFVSYLEQQELEKFRDVNKCSFENKKEQLLSILYMFSEDLLESRITRKFDVDFEVNYEGLDLKNIQAFSDKFYETLMALILALSNENFHTAVKIKLELSMMFYFYFSHKSEKFTSEEIEFFMQISEIIFKEVFSYNIADDFAAINLNYDLEKSSFFVAEHKNVQCTFLSKRSDGFGERVRSLLNTMALADYYNTDFRFQWREMPAKYHGFHSVTSKENTFKQSFLNQYHIDNMNALVIKDIENVTTFQELTQPDLYLNVHQNSHRSNSPIIRNVFASVNYKKLFDNIAFSEELEFACKEAEKVPLESNTVAIHLRAGDIVYGNFRFTDKYTTKVVPYTVALMLISKLQEMKLNILLFGQDTKLCHWICDHQNIKFAGDYTHIDFNNEQKSIFEIVLMSRCVKVYGGSSGFSILATMIGNMDRVDPKEVFSVEAALKNSIEILKKHIFNDFIPPMQVAYACNWLLSKGKDILSDDDYLYLVDLGAKMDPTNHMFTFLKTWKLYKQNQVDKAESLISFNTESKDTAFTDFLTSAYGPKHKLEYFSQKYLDVFKKVASMGYPKAAEVVNIIKNEVQNIAHQTDNSIFNHEWDVTYNLGIK